MKLSFVRYLALALGQVILALFSLSAWIYLYFGQPQTLVGSLITAALVATPLVLVAEVLRSWRVKHPYLQVAAANAIAVGAFQLLLSAGVYPQPIVGWALAVIVLSVSHFGTERVLARLPKIQLTKHKK